MFRTQNFTGNGYVPQTAHRVYLILNVLEEKYSSSFAKMMEVACDSEAGDRGSKEGRHREKGGDRGEETDVLTGNKS